MSPVGHYDPDKQRHRTSGHQRDAEGHTVCVHCGERFDKPDRKLRWHAECVQDHLIRSGGGAMRRATFRRDRGVCAICGMDCGAIDEAVDEARAEYWKAESGRRLSLVTPAVSTSRSVFVAHRLAERFPTVDSQVLAKASRGLHTWEADHIRPKAEGGAYTGLENVRTLCKACHARETGLLRRRLNAKGRKP